MSALISTLLLCTTFQSPTTPATQPPQTVKNAKPVPVGSSPVKSATTDAEKIANAQDAIKKGMEAVEKIQKRLDDPQGEYRKAEAEFTELNAKLKDGKAAVAKLRADGDEKKAAELESTMAGIQEDWQLAKERFDIAIRQKKESLEAIAGLKERISAEQELLDRLEGKARPPQSAKRAGANVPVADTPTGGKPVLAPPSPNSVPTTNAPLVVPETSPSPKTSAAVPLAAENVPGLPAAAVIPPISLTKPTSSGQSPETALTPTDDDPLVRQVRDRLDTEKDALHEAEDRVRLAEERVRTMERSIRTSEKSLQLENESILLMEKALAKLSSSPPQTDGDRDAHDARQAETEQRLTESRERVKRVTDRIRGLTESLAGLREEFAVVSRESDIRRAAVAASEAEIASLLSPTAPRNLFRWVIRKGPQLGFIVMGMLLLHLVVRQFSRHIVRFITRHSDRGSEEDRENRAHTLVGVFRYAAGLIIYGGGIVMLLDAIGVPVVPLMGGAAVLGLAVAFGAQNLIRDYFTGFMMLMEDQYSVNDVVRIGAIAGLVEQITLRMTVLRDLEGVRHFIPHGTITSVSNLTHGWSRAMLDIPVAYKENVDRVIDVLMELGREMRHDQELGKYIIEEPEMLGVDGFADSGVVIKFLLKTRPLRQWPVKRELLRRIKNRFDEMGIEIPFPHRTVFHRFPDGSPEHTLAFPSDRRVA